MKNWEALLAMSEGKSVRHISWCGGSHIKPGLELPPSEGLWHSSVGQYLAHEVDGWEIYDPPVAAAPEAMSELDTVLLNPRKVLESFDAAIKVIRAVEALSLEEAGAMQHRTLEAVVRRLKNIGRVRHRIYDEGDGHIDSWSEDDMEGPHVEWERIEEVIAWIERGLANKVVAAARRERP